MKRHADPEAAAARARARARTYYQTHKAELGAYRKAYWAEHKEQRRVIQKRWDDKNRARKRAEREST